MVPPRICFRSVGGLVSPVLIRFLLLLISPSISGASGVALSHASLIVDLSAGDPRDILPSVRTGDVQVFSGLPAVYGPSVSLAVTSSSVPRIVSDV